MDVGLPPPLPVRDVAKARVPLPSRLPHGDLLPGFDRPWRSRSDEAGRSPGPVGVQRQRHHDHGRSIPWHVGVVPDHRGQPAGGRIEPGGAVEVVALGERGLPATVRSGSQRDDRATWVACAVDVIGVVPLAYRHHPGSVGAGPEPAVRPALASRRLTREGDRRHPGARTEPHPLLDRIHVGECTRVEAGHQAVGAAAVLMHPAADAHARRRDIPHTLGVGPHAHDASAFGRSRLEPVQRLTVGRHFGHRDLPGRRLGRTERRGPTTEGSHRVHEKNVAVALVPAVVSWRRTSVTPGRCCRAPS